MKKTLITLIIIILIALGVVLGYFYFADDQPTSTEEGGLFPDGENGGFEEREGFDEFFSDQNGDGTADTVEQGSLLKLSDQPVAGGIIFEKQVSTSTTETYIRYVERGTGHIFEARAPGTAFTRISNTTILKARSAVWSPAGNIVLIQYEEENDSDSIKNFLAAVTKDQVEEVELRGIFLPDSIESPKFSPSGNTLSYIRKGDQESDVIVYEISSGISSIVYSSSIKEWSLSWANLSTLVLNTKPSGSASGFAYALPASGGELTKLVGGFRGLMTILSPNLETLVITASTERSFSSYLRGQGENTPLSSKIIPEKCVWAGETTLYCGVPSNIENGVYPDVWYEGRTSFSDVFWRINPQSGQSSVIRIPDEPVDAMNLNFSSNGSYLIFENKKDHSLWILALSQIDI
jgi:hypothetical protein